MKQLEKNNLNFLIKEFRSNKDVKRGYTKLRRYIRNNNLRQINYLLYRNVHFENFELVPYFNEVEYLFKYYKLLEVAIDTNFISSNLTRHIYSEIEFVLGNQEIKKYYSEARPQLLLQNMFERANQVKKQESGKRNGDSHISEEEFQPSLFYSFLALINELDNDLDVKIFQAVLEENLNFVFRLEDLIGILGNSAEFKRRISKSNYEDIGDYSLWGFIKFINILTDYKKLLDDSESNRLQQSAYWYYSSHLFITFKRQINDIIDKGFYSISRQVDYLEPSIIIDTGSHDDSKRFSEDWKSDSFKTMEQIKRDIQSIFSDRYMSPQIALNNSLKGR